VTVTGSDGNDAAEGRSGHDDVVALNGGVAFPANRVGRFQDLADVALQIAEEFAMCPCSGHHAALFPGQGLMREDMAMGAAAPPPAGGPLPVDLSPQGGAR
jgi:hypothetical protein